MVSTWDDKPNDYQHALLIIERLRARNELLHGLLKEARQYVSDAGNYEEPGEHQAALLFAIDATLKEAAAEPG